jgi:hypothetical protein
MSGEQIITIDSGITPVFTGTRVPVESLIDHLIAGETLEEFLDGFPSVGRRDHRGGRVAPAGVFAALPLSGRRGHIQGSAHNADGGVRAL